MSQHVIGCGILPVREEENGIIIMKSHDFLIKGRLSDEAPPAVSREGSSSWYLLVWLEVGVKLNHLDKFKPWREAQENDMETVGRTRQEGCG